MLGLIFENNYVIFVMHFYESIHNHLDCIHVGEPKNVGYITIVLIKMEITSYYHVLHHDERYLFNNRNYIICIYNISFLRSHLLKYINCLFIVISVEFVA